MAKIQVENEKRVVSEQVAISLSQLKHETGLSLNDLSIKGGVYQSTLSRIANAKVLPTIETLLKLAKGTKRSFVLEYTNENGPIFYFIKG